MMITKMCRIQASLRSSFLSWWLLCRSSRSVSGPPSGSGLRLLSPRLFSLLSSQSGAKGQMSKISFFQMNKTVSNRKEIIFVNSTIFSHIFSFFALLDNFWFWKLPGLLHSVPLGMWYTRIRVGKCQIFYTDKYQQTIFYPKKSA